MKLGLKEEGSELQSTQHQPGDSLVPPYKWVTANWEKAYLLAYGLTRYLEEITIQTY